MKKVFVSYSRCDLSVVTQLVQDLRAIGTETWYDQTLTGGQRWWDNILSYIRECDVFIFSLSLDSWESEACKSELSYASSLEKMIIPVLVGDGVSFNLLPPSLQEFQVADYRKADKDATIAIIKAVNSAPIAGPMPNPLPTQPPVPVSYLSSLKERIDSSTNLTAQEQIQLLFELEQSAEGTRSISEIRDLLLRMKRRDDLLAKVALKVDEALKRLDDRTETRTFFDPVSVPLASHEIATLSVNSDTTICAKCNSEIDVGSKFCKFCGATQFGSPQQPPSINYKKSVEHSQIRQYELLGENLNELVSELKTWLISSGFDLQEVNVDDGILIQIKKLGTWRQFVGMSTSLNILLKKDDNVLNIEIGAGKWLDKAAVGAVSLFVLWPLAVTAGIGAWEQSRMPDKIFEFFSNKLHMRRI